MGQPQRLSCGIRNHGQQPGCHGQQQRWSGAPACGSHDSWWSLSPHTAQCRCVNLDVILSVTLLSLLLDRLLVALLVGLAEALQVVMGLAIASRGSQAQGRQGQNNGKSEHFGCRISSHLSLGVEAEAI